MATTRRRLAIIALLLSTMTTACGDGTIFKETTNVGGKNDQPGFDVHLGHADRGLEVDLANYLGKHLGFTPQIIDVATADREQVLLDGRATLVIATYSITEKREEKVDFVGPYLNTYQSLLVRKDDNRIKSGDKRADAAPSLKGMTVCTVSQSTSADVVLPGSPAWRSEKDYSACVDSLRKKDVDAVFTDEAVLYGFTQTNPDVKVVPDLTFGRINRYGIGIAKGHTKDCKRLLSTLRDFVRDEWAKFFSTQLPAIVKAYKEDWENKFRPDLSELDQYSSCGG